MNQKTRPKTMEMYDVNSYTEEELINNILDLNNPTDRELEHKILSLYNRYQIIETKQGQQLAKFFKDIYDRFFDDDDNEDDDDDNGNDDDNEEDEEEDDNENNIDTIEGFESTPTMTPTPTSTSNLKYTWSTPAKQSTQEVNFTKPTDYAQDKLNPTIKDTIKRIISIDSQYRDDKRTMSTNFTFSLSEHLRDVLSLKLYSIQIPQTWYTVPKSYGCNFFYLKGNSRGIDNGYHDYTIDISAGNYTANDLIKALNTKIQELKKTFPDVNFGNTNIGYNPNAALTTLSINMNNTYNESAYYLYFPTWTPPNSNNSLIGPRYKSIPGFLGFNYRNYYLNRIYSTATLPWSTDTVDSDNINNYYEITDTNNYFTIYKYVGPNEFSVNSVVDISFQIKLKTGKYTRTELVSDLNNQLASNKYLKGSSIQRIDITDPLLNNHGQSFFQLQINYNRSTTNNIVNSKTYIEFPTETTSPKIWTGINSCFHFQNTKNELNNVVSENSPITQQSGKYVITLNTTPGKYPYPYIYLSCVKPQYNVIENNYIIDLSDSSAAGYDIEEYFAAINKGIVGANNRTITSKNTSGDFNLQNFRAYKEDTTSNFNIGIDITRKFTRDMYYIDLKDTFLKSLIRLSGEYLDGQKDLLGSTYTFTSSFQENAYYEVDSNNMLKAIPSRLNYGNQSAQPFIVTTSGIGTIYFTYQEVENAINNAFNNFTDTYGEQIFAGTNIVMTPNGFTGLIECVFTIQINKTITQKDYTISFIDEAAEKDGGNILLSTSTWSNNLNIEAKYLGTGRVNGIADNSYNLSLIGSRLLPYTTIIAENPITINVISFIEGQNNFFYLVPWEEGVATGRPYYANDNHANDIKITIPAVDNHGKINYTRDNLITTINQLLNDRAETKGSSIQIIKVRNSEYTKFRFNVNKVYSAYDYKLVFYDQLSFNKCSPGAQYIQNTTWDTTIGWLIGFHNNTEFALSDYGTPGTEIQIVGDTTATVNLFDYFLLCVDDYNQNRLNDGLVTVTSAERSFSMPAYANKANYVCDPTTGLLTYNATAENTVDYNRLTQNQLYSLTQLANSKSESSIITSTPNVNGKSYGSGPYAEDVFGFIPMKTAGLTPGAVYVDYGGTLQNQERSYFGPVNISKLGIKLVSNRGDVIDLNGSNWSFSFIVEQLYQQKPSIAKKKT